MNTDQCKRALQLACEAATAPREPLLTTFVALEDVESSFAVAGVIHLLFSISLVYNYHLCVMRANGGGWHAPVHPEGHGIACCERKTSQDEVTRPPPN